MTTATDLRRGERVRVNWATGITEFGTVFSVVEFEPGMASVDVHLDDDTYCSAPSFRVERAS